nr:hypothetical protein [Tanacetum cinerariifolium]
MDFESYVKANDAILRNMRSQEDDPDSSKINPFYYDSEGDILLLEAILNSEPSPPLPNLEQNLPSFKEEHKAYEAQTVKSSVDEPPEVELKDLPHHLEYAFLECDNKLPVIIAKQLGRYQPGILYTQNLKEEDYKLAVQHQRRVNPKIHDVIKKEVEKLLDAGLIYPISDSPWVSLVHCVPKKGGFTVVENEENELIPTRLVTGWRRALSLAIRFKQTEIEVDRAKVNVIAKLTHPTTVKGIRSFLGHAGFYRCFIQDFSKISQPMTHLLEKNTPFVFFEDCIQAFQTLNKKLTEAPILIAPNWDLLFELMCDASDFAVGAVLGQRQEKHFKLIHYASKTMNDAETNYTITKKEMLAVVRLSTFSKLATMDPRGDTMVQISLPKRSLILVSSGPPSTKVPTSLLKTVTRANDKENFHNAMRCHKTPSKFVKSLTFGALTLWSHSLLHEGTSIFLWRSTICQNGLKRKRSPPTTPVLFANSSNLFSPDLVHHELS